MRVLGINAIFHDPAAALVVDGTVVAAAEEERFSRRKHGKRPVPFSAWELPELSAAWCLRQAGLDAASLDAVAYSFDPGLCRDASQLGLTDPWDWLRIEYAKRAPQFLAEVLPGLDPEIVRFVPHHVAHAASAGLAAPRTRPARPARRCWYSTAGARPRATSAGSTARGGCNSSPHSSCRTRWDCSTRTSPGTSASCTPATSTR
ncbi:hypothetical protein GCM10027615_47650 [Plantactinospora veratri]